MANLPSVADQIEKLFDELVHRRWGATTRILPAQVRTVPDGWEIEVPVPGMRAEEIEVQVSGRELWVRGASERRSERQWPQGLWARSARNVSFARSFLLPEAVDPSDVDARLEDGTLRVHVRRTRR